MAPLSTVSGRTCRRVRTVSADTPNQPVYRNTFESKNFPFARLDRLAQRSGGSSLPRASRTLSGRAVAISSYSASLCSHVRLKGAVRRGSRRRGSAERFCVAAFPPCLFPLYTRSPFSEKDSARSFVPVAGERVPAQPLRASLQKRQLRMSGTDWSGPPPSNSTQAGKGLRMTTGSVGIYTHAY